MPTNGRADPGFGPPPGSVGDGPYPARNISDLVNTYANPRTPIDMGDPAFQSPTSPLTPAAKQRAGLVYRDLPLITVQNTWSVEMARSALYTHVMGIFETSAQLWDSILGDDRVHATLGSRIAGLFGREVRFHPADDSMAAREVCDAWEKWWPRLTSDASFTELHTYGIGMGFSMSQLVWDTSGPLWGPYLRPWHPRFTYYHWPTRRFRALSQDGEISIIPGDAKWVLHAPFGEYRGWIRGAIRAIAEPWMLRHFAFRDMARFSEIHGLPTRVGKVPAVSDPGERAAFEQAIGNLGSDTAMILPQSVDTDGAGYDYSLVEATDTAWEAFPGLIDRCDMAIVLSLLFQNLTTEVQGGSFAATKSHMDIRESGLQADNQAWKNTIYNQIARPFAWLNFGDPELAPWTTWNVAPRDELELNAKQFQQFGTAIEVLRRGGIQFNDPEQVRLFAQRRFGLDGLPDFMITEPVSGGGMGH